MRRTIGVVSAIWTAPVAGSFAWNHHAARAAQERVALQTARSFFEQVVITRR